MKHYARWFGVRAVLAGAFAALLLTPGQSALADYTHGSGSSGLFQVDTYAQVLYPDSFSSFSATDLISFETAHYYSLHNTDTMHNQNITYNYGETLGAGLMYGLSSTLASASATNVTFPAGPGGTYTQSEADLGYNGGPYAADNYFVRANTYIIVGTTTVSMATQDHTFSTH